jgi:hypothetical protein
VSSPSSENGNRSSFKAPCSLEYRTIEKVQNPSNAECYTAYSEPFRIYLLYGFQNAEDYNTNPGNISGPNDDEVSNLGHYITWNFMSYIGYVMLLRPWHLGCEGLDIDWDWKRWYAYKVLIVKPLGKVSLEDREWNSRITRKCICYEYGKWIKLPQVRSSCEFRY